MSYLGATVLPMFVWFPFRPFNFLSDFGNRFTFAVMFGATSSTCLNMFLQPKNGIFQMPDPAGWVQGKWSYHGKLILNKLSVCLFFFCFFSLTVKIILETLVAIGQISCHGPVLVNEQILT